MSFEIRPVDKDEYTAFARSVGGAFGSRPTDVEIADWLSLAELDRTLAVLDGGQIVGNAGAFSFEMAVPGGATVPVAGVTAVGVRSTHRRRGLLRAMMKRQLDDVAERGEPAAILTASESIIYGRFGYGLATAQASVTLDTSHSAFQPSLDDPGQIRMLDGDEAGVAAAAVHDRARLVRPGDISRSPAWWALTARDPDYRHAQASALFWAVHRSADGVDDGYVSYRYKAGGGEWLADSEIRVADLVGTNPQAEAALWRFVCDIDLANRVSAWSRPVDDPIRWRLADPRHMRTTSLRDDLWLRILDVPAALSARRYGTDGSLVIEVTDGFRPAVAGRYRLDGTPGGATCDRTTAAPDLTMGIADLGAVYLGNVDTSLLARAGRIDEHTPGALKTADRLFGGDVLPFCRTGF